MEFSSCGSGLYELRYWEKHVEKKEQRRYRYNGKHETA